MAKKDTALWLIGGGIAAWFLLSNAKKSDESQLIPSLDISGLLPDISGIDFGSLLPNLGEMDFNKLIPDISGMDFSGLIPDFSNLFGGFGGGGDGITFPLLEQVGEDWGLGFGKIGDIWSQIVSGPRAYYEGWMDFWYRQTIGPGLEARQAETMSEMYATAQAHLSPEQFELMMARERGEISGPEFTAALQALLASLTEAVTGPSPESASISEFIPLGERGAPGSFFYDVVALIERFGETPYRLWETQQAGKVYEYMGAGAPALQKGAAYTAAWKAAGAPGAKPLPTKIGMELMRQGYTRYEAGEIYSAAGGELHPRTVAARQAAARTPTEQRAYATKLATERGFPPPPGWE